MTRRKIGTKKGSPLRPLTKEQKSDIFDRLVARDAKIRAAAEELADEMLATVDFDDIAEDVAASISELDVDVFYAKTGGTSDGYVDPYEYAREYLEDQVAPFFDDLENRRKEGRIEEAQVICMGIILGLYRFRGEDHGTDEVLGFDSEFPDEAAEEALELYTTGRRQLSYGGVRKSKKATRVPPLPESFWERVPEWRGMARRT
jgi:hypothetical protein